MERRQLEYFLAVVEHGGFSNAARVLHVSQPSLSQSIASLEHALGGILFHRLPHGTTLTAAGDALVGPAKQVARDLRTAADAVREVLGLSGGHLDVVAQTTLAMDPLADLIGLFLCQRPQVTVNVTDPVNGADVVAQVRSGAAELGLVDSAVPIGDLRSELMGLRHLQLVLPPGTTALSPTPLESLKDLRFVATPEGTATRAVINNAMSLVNLRPRISVETAHRAMIVPLVMAGAGCALLPEGMAADAAVKGATVVRVQPELTYRARMIWRVGELSPAAAYFVNMAISSNGGSGAGQPV